MRLEIREKMRFTNTELQHCKEIKSRVMFNESLERRVTLYKWCVKQLWKPKNWECLQNWSFPQTLRGCNNGAIVVEKVLYNSIHSEKSNEWKIKGTLHCLPRQRNLESK